MGAGSARDSQAIVELTDGTNEVNLGPRGLPIHGFDIDTIVRFRSALMCRCQLYSTEYIVHILLQKGLQVDSTRLDVSFGSTYHHVCIERWNRPAD